MSHTVICWRRRNNVINREARNIPACVDEDFEAEVETEFDTNGVEFNANGNDPDEKYEVDAVCSSDINVDVVVADVIKSVGDTEDVEINRNGRVPSIEKDVVEESIDEVEGAVEETGGSYSWDRVGGVQEGEYLVEVLE